MRIHERSEPTFGEILGKGLGAGLSESLVESLRGHELRGKAMATVPAELRGAGKEPVKPGQQLQGGGGQMPSEQAQSEVPLSEKESEIFSPLRLKQRSKEIFDERMSSGMPISFDEAKAIANQENAEKINYQSYQKNITDETNAKYSEFFGPSYSPDIKAYAARKAEEYARQNMSPAQVTAKVVEDAKNLKNMLHEVKLGIKPVKGWDVLSDDKRSNQIRSLRQKVQGLKDLGLYDEAREALGASYIDPEGIEEVMSGLGENTSRNISSLSKFGPSPGPGLITLKPESVDKFKSTMTNVLQEDPSTNLILLRKEFNKKGVDWRYVKEAVNDLIESGQFKPNRDQMRQIQLLEEPPLAGLEKYLRTFIGQLKS